MATDETFHPSTAQQSQPQQAQHQQPAAMSNNLLTDQKQDDKSTEKKTTTPLAPDADKPKEEEKQLGWQIKVFFDEARTISSTIIYVKAMYTGKETAYIRLFKAANQDFPHHSQFNQTFDYDTFRAYAKLGKHAVRQVKPSFNELFEKIYK